jgi:hypothetical protein
VILETDMTHKTTEIARIGLATLAVTILIAGFCSEAVAKVHHRHLHAVRSSSYESRAQFVPVQPAQSGPIRYFGGPKSSMWRG